MVNKNILAALAIIFAASLWGLDGVVLRPMLYHLDVPVVVFLEHAIGFLIISWLIYFNYDKIKKIKRDTLASFIWIGIFGGAIGTMAITKALFYVNFNHLSVIVILQKLQPMFAILLAFFILGERPRKNFYIWACLAVMGSYLVTFGFGNPIFAGNQLLIAGLLSVLAAFSFGSSTVFGRKALLDTDYKTATLLRFGITTIIMIIVIGLLSIVQGFNRFSGVMDLTGQNFLILVLIALSSGAVAIFIYYYGLKRVQASRATIYELGFPVTAVLLDFILHGTILSPGQWIGAVLIVFSMTQITKNG